jgi:hypothetical protein
MPKLRPTLKHTALITTLIFIRIGVSLAKADINSDPAIAERPTAGWWLCRERNASEWAASSHYHLKADGRWMEALSLQNRSNDTRPVIQAARRG